MKSKDDCFLAGKWWQTDSVLKSKDITLPTKVHVVKAMVFPVLTYGCESWTVKKAECQRIDAFELWCWTRLLKDVWTERRSNQSILRTRRTEAEAEAPVFWSPDENRGLIGTIPDAGKDWGQKEKRVSEDEMAGQLHQCNECELGQTPEDGVGQGGLACCSPGGRKELDMAGQLNNNNNNGSSHCSTGLGSIYCMWSAVMSGQSCANN